MNLSRLPEGSIPFTSEQERKYLNELIRILRNNYSELELEIERLKRRVETLENP